MDRSRCPWDCGLLVETGRFAKGRLNAININLRVHDVKFGASLIEASGGSPIAGVGRLERYQYPDAVSALAAVAIEQTM